jgi:hypothetical protein
VYIRDRERRYTEGANGKTPVPRVSSRQKKPKRQKKR